MSARVRGRRIGAERIALAQEVLRPAFERFGHLVHHNVR